jgi:hypothetical protein
MSANQTASNFKNSSSSTSAVLLKFSTPILFPHFETETQFPLVKVLNSKDQEQSTSFTALENFIVISE